MKKKEANALMINFLIEQEYKETPARRVAKEIIRMKYTEEEFAEFCTTPEGKAIDDTIKNQIRNAMRDIKRGL